jgi:hypothetical protein
MSARAQHRPCAPPRRAPPPIPAGGRRGARACTLAPHERAMAAAAAAAAAAPPSPDGPAAGQREARQARPRKHLGAARALVYPSRPPLGPRAALTHALSLFDDTLRWARPRRGAAPRRADPSRASSARGRRPRAHTARAGRRLLAPATKGPLARALARARELDPLPRPSISCCTAQQAGRHHESGLQCCCSARASVRALPFPKTVPTAGPSQLRSATAT